jgi:hypothetical protein
MPKCREKCVIESSQKKFIVKFWKESIRWTMDWERQNIVFNVSSISGGVESHYGYLCIGNLHLMAFPCGKYNDICQLHDGDAFRA